MFECLPPLLVATSAFGGSGGRAVLLSSRVPNGASKRGTMSPFFRKRARQGKRCRPRDLALFSARMAIPTSGWHASAQARASLARQIPDPRRIGFDSYLVKGATMSQTSRLETTAPINERHAAVACNNALHFETALF